MIPFKISFPIRKAYRSDRYPLIIQDNDEVDHYWDEDGNYDGYGHRPNIDSETRTSKN